MNNTDRTERVNITDLIMESRRDNDGIYTTKFLLGVGRYGYRGSRIPPEKDAKLIGQIFGGRGWITDGS